MVSYLSLLLHPAQINTPLNDHNHYHTLLTFLLLLTDSTTHQAIGVPSLQFMLLVPAARSYVSSHIPGFVGHHTTHRHNDILMSTMRKTAFIFILIDPTNPE